jgi:hypothetical protein
LSVARIAGLVVVGVVLAVCFVFGLLTIRAKTRKRWRRWLYGIDMYTPDNIGGRVSTAAMEYCGDGVLRRWSTAVMEYCGDGLLL